jgi:hypothetical protein
VNKTNPKQITIMKELKMLKKILVLGVVMVAVLAVAFAGYVGYASAQTPQPGTQTFGPGHMMGGRGNSGETYQGMGPGTMGRRGGQGTGQGTGVLHTYMVAAFADALDLTPEALQGELDAGKKIYDVAAEKGFTDEQFVELMTTARTTALEQAVAAGDITQEQADWMQQRWGTRLANGFTPGNCPMHSTTP